MFLQRKKINVKIPPQVLDLIRFEIFYYSLKYQEISKKMQANLQADFLMYFACKFNPTT